MHKIGTDLIIKMYISYIYLLDHQKRKHMHAQLYGMGFDLHNERRIWLMHIPSFASCKIEQAKMHHDLEYIPRACVLKMLWRQMDRVL